MLKTLPEEVEAYRDRSWRREPEARVETAVEGEKLVEAAGFCATMTDSRRPGPSLYVAVCGRRDAHMPRNVQKDPERSEERRVGKECRSLCDWSSDVCSSDLLRDNDRLASARPFALRGGLRPPRRAHAAQRAERPGEIGRASCRERV